MKMRLSWLLDVMWIVLMRKFIPEFHFSTLFDPGMEVIETALQEIGIVSSKEIRVRGNCERLKRVSPI